MAQNYDIRELRPHVFDVTDRELFVDLALTMPAYDLMVQFRVGAVAGRQT